MPTHGSPWLPMEGCRCTCRPHGASPAATTSLWALAPSACAAHPAARVLPVLDGPSEVRQTQTHPGLGCPGCAHTSRRATRSTSERFDFSTPVRLARLLPPPIRFLPLLNPNSPTKPNPTRKCNSTQSQPSAPLREFALRPSAEEARLEYFSPRPTPAPFRRSLPAGPERQRERASPNGRALLIARVTTVSQPSAGCACASLEPSSRRGPRRTPVDLR